MSAFEHLLTGWDGQQVAVRYDAEFATWMFIGVHSTANGRSGGGTRMAVYAAPEDGLADALKLSLHGDDVGGDLGRQGVPVQHDGMEQAQRGQR